MTPQERIKADAEAKYHLVASHTITDGPRDGYIAGATAENSRAQVLVDALEAIANSPTPTNEREMYSWIDTARTMAITAREQWKFGKEVGDDA